MLWPNGSKSKPYVSSAFGPRKAPVAGASTNHKGTDFSHTFGRIRAIAPGRVVVAGTPGGWSGGGTQVWLQHDGFFTRSLHMVAGSLTVKVGDLVTEGQDLGAMGRTGTATDTHLHFELTLGNWHTLNTGQIDPVPFITSRLASTAGGSTSTPEGFLMALTSDQQDDLYRRIKHLDSQTTGSDNQVPSIASRVIAIQEQVNGLPDGLAAIKAQVNGAPEVLAAIRADIKGIKTTGGSVDVEALATALRGKLAPEIVKALGAALVNG